MRKYLLALFCGLLFPLGFAPFDYWPLTILSISLALYLVSEKVENNTFLLGLFYGIGQWGFGISWVYVSIHYHGNQGIFSSFLITSAFVFFLSLYTGLTFYLIKKFRTSNKNLNYLLLFPVIWVTVEIIRSYLFTGFPWLIVGASLAGTSVGGWIPILGTYGATILAVMISGCLVLFFRNKKKMHWSPALIIVIILLSSFTLNKINWTEHTGEALNVALVQGNISQEIKWHPTQKEESFNIYTELSEPFWLSDLIIWPETAIASKYHRTNNFIRKINKKRQGPSAFFMTGIVKENTNSGTYFNSILLIDNKHRFYNKHHLVPFGEYLPLRKILYHPLRIFNIPISNFSSGKYDEKNLQTSKGNFGMSICYEDAYGNEVRRSMPDANILINVSNDAWFGNSMAPHQHLQIARMRAIENGRYFLRATNNGISAIIDNRGKIISRSPQFEKHVLNVNVALFTGATPYSKYGNMPLLIFFALFTLINIIKRRLFLKIT